VTWWCPQLPPSPAAAMRLVELGIAGWPRESMGVIGSSLAIAADAKVDPVLTAQTKESFEKQATGIRAQMATGGRYQFIKLLDLITELDRERIGLKLAGVADCFH